MTIDITPILQLSAAEKLELMEILWESLADTPEDIPVTDWQKEELTRRKARHQQDPGSALSWEQVKERLR